MNLYCLIKLNIYIPRPHPFPLNIFLHPRISRILINFKSKLITYYNYVGVVLL